LLQALIDRRELILHVNDRSPDLFKLSSRVDSGVMLADTPIEVLFYAIYPTLHVTNQPFEATYIRSPFGPVPAGKSGSNVQLLSPILPSLR